MKYSGVNRIIILTVVFSLLSLYVFAAGGGGGGGSSSGLGFSSRDSIYILVSQEYTSEFSLKNRTKYDLKINVEDSNTTVTFGSYYLQLSVGDNFLDLNGDNFANINFNLVKVDGKRANVRIITVKEKIAVTIPKTVIEKAFPKEDALGVEKIDIDGNELKCGNLETLRERVSCRIGLEEDDLEDELELYYMPEECRSLTGSMKGICIARYKSVQTCWKFPIGGERTSCAKKSLKLENIQEEKETCDSLTGQEKSNCARDLKNKVYNIIKWRFYDLEERAEDFMKRGLADEESVFDFISKSEQNKVKFNLATTIEERKNIILDVRNDWNDFVQIVKGILRGQDEN